VSGSSGHRETGGATSAHLLAFDDPSGRAAYERLWAASPQRTPFAHPAYVEAVARAFGYTPRLAAVADGDGPLRGAGDSLREADAFLRESGDFAAALPVFEKRRGPLRVAALPPITFLVTPLLAAPPKASEVHARHSPLDALLALLAARYHRASLLLHPSLADARPLLWAGWRVAPRYTYALDLADLDRGAWTQTTRWQVNKEASRYRIAEDATFAEDAVAFTEAAYRRRGTSLGLDGAAERRLASALVGAGLARAFGAIPEGEAAPEAAVVVLHDGQTAVDWLAGSRPGPAMNVLLAAVLARLAADGLRHFDLGGANTPSIAEFKRKFGGRLVPYFHARIVPHPALRLLDRLRP
jgi:hypothetical protein